MGHLKRFDNLITFIAAVIVDAAWMSAVTAKD
jgi:hypothetical protein